MKHKQDNQPGKIAKLWPFLVKLHNENPGAFADEHVLKHIISGPWPAIKDPSHCPNCNTSMRVMVTRPNPLHIVLLEGMAKSVRSEIRKGVPFTQANRTHIDRLPIITAAKKQQSHLGYLGLIKQPKGTKRSGYWVITTWGWRALAGGSFPDAAMTWNRKLISRSTTRTTLASVRDAYRSKMERQSRYGKAVKSADHRSDLAGYNPIEWTEYSGTIDAPEPEENTSL